jgi:hypothetical protein
LNVSVTVPDESVVDLYTGLHGTSQGDQITEAGKLVAEPQRVARAFAEERRRFESFAVNEPFYPAGTRKPLPEHVSESRRTPQLAALLWRPPVWDVVGHPELGFRYVDREIATSRTTKGSDGKRPLSVDLLLANADDRTPIVGELKLGGDQNAFYALIQGLVHAARLASPKQLERLRRFYADHFAREQPSGVVDLYVVLRDAPTAGTRPKLLELANTLAGELTQDAEVTQHVRRIACIAAQTDADPVRFDALFAYGAGCPGPA